MLISLNEYSPRMGLQRVSREAEMHLFMRWNSENQARSGCWRQWWVQEVPGITSVPPVGDFIEFGSEAVENLYSPWDEWEAISFNPQGTCISWGSSQFPMQGMGLLIPALGAVRGTGSALCFAVRGSACSSTNPWSTHS